MSSSDEGLACVLLDRIAGALVLVDSRGSIVHASSAASQLLRRAPGSLRGQPVATLLDAKPGAVEAMLERANETDERQAYLRTLVRRDDGHTLVMDLHVSALVLDDRLHTLFELEPLGVSEGDREKQWRLFSLATTNLLWNWDFSTNLVERNIGFETAFGYQKEEVDAAIGWWVDRLHDDDRERVLGIFQRTLDAGREHCAYEYRFRRRDGSYADIRDSVFIMRDASRAGVRALGAMTDISKERALDQERARADRLTSVGLLAAGVAHDFNNLLMGVTMSTDMLSRRLKLEARERRLMDNITKACRAMTALAQRMLTFSRGGHPELSAVDICAVVREHAELATSGSSVRLALELPSEPVISMVDPTQLGQAVGNIALNAVQAMLGGGHLEVSVGRGPPPPAIETDMDEWIAIRIGDDGPGIDEGTLANIFELYYTTRDGGTGLGLAVASSIIHRHGGSLEVQSKLGDGTVFTINLPLLPGEDRREEADDAKAPAARGGSVLVLDDDETALLAVCGAFESLGYRVTEARDELGAVGHYEEARALGQRFDLAVLDLTLRGGQDGASVGRRLRALEPETPLILMSGYSEHDAMRDFRSHGFAARLKKPFDLDSLTRAIDLALASRG